MNQNSLKNLLAKYSNKQQIASGKQIFTYEQPADKIYLILKGLIRLFIKTNPQQEEEIARLTAGNILGKLALAEDRSHSAKAVAHENTTLLAFTPQDFKKITYHHPGLNEKLINSFCSRLHQLQQPNPTLPELTTTEPDNKEPKQTTAEKSQADNHQAASSNLFPTNHGAHSAVAKEDFAYYLYSKTISCPICDQEIEVKKVRSSRLHLKKIREDLRPIYKKFNPSWYKIWSCPNCFYTARRKDFFDFRKRTQNRIKDNFQAKIKNKLGTQFQPVYSEPRRLEEVFTAYYLALELYNFISAGRDKLAYLWLHLSWLYEDAQEEELSTTASRKAMEYFAEFYYSGDSTFQLSRTQRNKQTLLLAFLFAKHNREEEALPLLDDLIRSSQLNRRYQQLARDKFMEIRHNKD